MQTVAGVGRGRAYNTIDKERRLCRAMLNLQSSGNKLLWKYSLFPLMRPGRIDNLYKPHG